MMNRGQQSSPPRIKTLILDVDGVLTSAMQNLDEKGEKVFKSFHCRDISAIRILISEGWDVYMISADDWPGGAAFAKKVGAEFLFSRYKHNLTLPWDQAYGVGDDLFWDGPWLDKCRVSFCPQDASIGLLRSGDHIRLGVKGGEGVVDELLYSFIRKAQEHGIHDEYDGL